MVKAELIASVAQEQGLKATQVQQAVDTLFDLMSSALAQGQRVEIRGFASFKIRDYQGYRGRNPRTGDTVSVDSKRGVVFKPGFELRRRVNKKESI